MNEMHLNWPLRAVRDSNPLQLKFEFDYWTLKLVRQALIDKFGLTLSISVVRRALRALGMSSQKPKVNAYQRDDKAFEKWRGGRVPEDQQGDLALAAVALEDRPAAAEAAEAVAAAGRAVQTVRPAGGEERVLALPFLAVGVEEGRDAEIFLELDLVL